MGNQDFVLIESLDELASWKPSSANPLHISNTPLLPRPTASIAPPSSAAEWPQGTSQSEPNENSIGSRPSPAPISKLLICHDFKGGYLPYEAPQGAETTERVYTYEYLQFVDSFVYFSHKRVAIPPASWINHMHKNGVKILGTFIVEGRNGTSELEDLLWHEYEDPTKFVFVDKLVEIAQIYKFDGWLLNFESSFPSEIFNLPTFKAWLESLRTEMHRAVPGSQVIWWILLFLVFQSQVDI